MASYLFSSNQTFEETLFWRTAENSVPYMIPILDKLPPNFVLLDVGCGPGTITCDFAKRYPSATILGFDFSADLIESARKWAQEKGVSNVRFAVGDIYDLDTLTSQPGFEAIVGGCDVVHAHQVLVHTTDVVGMLQKMRQAAKPKGGFVCSRDLDATSRELHPFVASVDAVWDLLVRLMEARGQHPRGVGQTATALAAGFNEEDVTVGRTNWDFKSLVERQNIMNISIKSMKQVLQNEKARDMVLVDIDQALKDTVEWVKSEESWLRLPCSELVCQRA